MSSHGLPGNLPETFAQKLRNSMQMNFLYGVRADWLLPIIAVPSCGLLAYVALGSL